MGAFQFKENKKEKRKVLQIKYVEFLILAS